LRIIFSTADFKDFLYIFLAYAFFILLSIAYILANEGYDILSISNKNLN